MADPLEVRVPDIGDFADVPIIEVMVSPGDTVAEEDPLVTLESDKATMDVPSPAAGTMGELKVVGRRHGLRGHGDPHARGRRSDGAADGRGRRRGRGVQGAGRPSPRRPSRRAATAQTIEVHVPDIGDFSDVPVIEVMVHPGDTVAEEDPLITLESDKATMDVPSPAAGTIRELKVSVGDTVSEGTLILTLDGAGAAERRRARGRPGERRAAVGPGPVRRGHGRPPRRRRRARLRARAATPPRSAPPTSA